MRFAQWTYLGAGLYGLLVLVPQYFLETSNGIAFPPPVNHPEYYYGFVSVAVAWQLAFVLISTDPKRYRPLTVATVFEKYSYGVAALILYAQDRLALTMLVFGCIDLLLGTLFIIAFKTTGGEPEPR